MIKQLVLISLIALSLQIEHCKKEEQICKTCNTGYTLIKYDSARTECIKTTEYNRIKDITPNCIEGEGNQCSACARTFAFDLEKNKCVEGPHCKKMRNEICEECDPIFFNNKGKCVEKHFCTQMEGDNCVDCENWYYPKDGECKEIPIKNCKIGNAKNCTECNKAVSYLDDKKQCSDFPSHCDGGSFDHDRKECTKCYPHYYLTDQKQCNEIGITDCLEGKPDKCDKCNETVSYLNDQNKCSKQPTNCLIFSQSEKQCTKCYPHYYLTDQKQCNEIGITDCLEGKPGHCDKCDTGCDLNDDSTNCIRKCTATEPYCYECNDNYESFDYGATCTVMDEDKEPKPEPKPQPEENASFTNLNLAFIALILSFIL